MVWECGKDIETCREAFCSGLHSGQIYGYVGKIRKSSAFSFRVANRRHFFRNTRERTGGRLPIFVYMHGRASTSSSGTTLQTRFWYGLPVWAYLIFYVVTFLCLSFVSFRYNGISPVFVALCAMGVTVLFALFSVACSSLTLLGGDDRKELEEFLMRSLEQDEL